MKCEDVEFGTYDCCYSIRLPWDVKEGMQYATGGEKMFNEFGRFLRAYRIPRGMLLYDMAMDLSMSLALLSGYENGRYSIPPFVKQQLIETYPDMDCEKLEKVIEKVNKEVRT